MEDIKLKKRLLDLSYKYKLSHLGSYFSSLDIMDEIFNTKKDEDIFILSSGHCAMALYAVLEKHQNINAEMLFEKHGGHPHRDEANGLYCSTGSLGLGLPIAVGRALANPNKDVYCLISDGECAEGSIWESLRYIHENNIVNIKVYVNMNGVAAYKEINISYLANRLKAFLPSVNLRYTTVEHFPFLRGLNAHYHIMSDDDYNKGKELLTAEGIS
jgi:transketolase